MTNKKEFVTAVSEMSGQTKKDTERFVDAFSATVVRFLANGEDVRIPKLGIFSTKVRAEHDAKNPRTGEKVFVPEARIARFKFANTVKEMINN